MKNMRKFSIFISSTYEDLKKERQALVGVALENNLIPVGMEQFHAAPTSQWNVITKMINESDLYLLVIGGRYGSIDKETGLSYTEKEYNYAKTKPPIGKQWSQQFRPADEPAQGGAPL